MSLGMFGGSGCGSHHGKSHKKKHSKNKRSKMRRGGMGCGSHHGKSHKKKHSKKRRGGMGCGSHHGKSHKKKHSKKRRGGMGDFFATDSPKAETGAGVIRDANRFFANYKLLKGGMGCGSHTKKRKHSKRK